MYLLCDQIVLILLCFTSIEAFFFRDNVDCLMTAWSQWSGMGVQTRSRRFMGHPSGRGRPCEELTEIRVYGVECEVSEWTQWSENFGFGQQIRSRTITQPSIGAGDICPELEEIRYTVYGVDCEVSEWTQWSENFGFGQQIRTRTITQPSIGAGDICPELEEIRYTGNVPSVNVTAKHVENYFVRPNGNYNEDNQNVQGMARDLLIIMDSSGSIYRAPFEDAKNQTSKLIGLLCPTDVPFDKVAGRPYQYNQAAMLTFSHIVEETFDFKRYNTTSDIQNAISRATYFDRSTNTAEAFRRAIGLFTTVKGARDPARAKREVLILTDGKSDNAAEAVAAAESLKQVADVYGLITGSFSPQGKEEITKYVSKPQNRHLFYVEDYEILRTLVAYIEREKREKTRAGQEWCAPFDV